MLNISWHPITYNCKKVLLQGDQCILGISPFNSRFSVDYIQILYQCSIKHFKNICFYIPDEPAVYSFLALSYENNIAKKRVKRQCNYLKNKIFRALGELGLSRNDVSEKILTHSFLKLNKDYTTMKDIVYSLYLNNHSFRSGCLETTMQSFNSQKQYVNPPIDFAQIAVNYFLLELPVFINGSKILNVDSCNFCYHSCPNLLEKMFLNDKYNIIRSNNSFIKIEISDN